MTTENIFGNDILNGEISTSLVPELGTESILIDTAPSEISLIDPLTQELSLTEPDIFFDEIDSDNNSSSNNASSLNNVALSNIDPLIAANAEEFQVNNVSASNALFTPSIDELQLQGGFGDYDGGDDVTFEVKNDDGVVVETYALTGEGQASLYRDDEDGKAYISFSGTDENTSVEISAKSNIQFGSYFGDSLEIETTGSIDGGSVSLTNPDETGLVLKSGIESAEETSDIVGYDYEIVSLGFADVKGINNNGDVLVRQTAYQSFIYSDGEIEYIGSGERLTRVEGINDSRQVVGHTDFPSGRHAFLYSNGSMSDLGVMPQEELSNDIMSLATAINNNGQIVGWSDHNERFNSPLRAFLSNGGSMTDLSGGLEDLYIDYLSPWGNQNNRSYATAINDLGQIIGTFAVGSDNGRAFLYDGSQYIDLYNILGEGKRVRSLVDINNEGQIIGGSFIYDDGNIYDYRNIESLGSFKLYDINNNGETIGFGDINGVTGSFLYNVNKDSSIHLNKLVDSSEGFALSRPQFINDAGQITGYGNYNGTQAIYLLTPKFAEPELDDYISISNISTFGDTVLLQGNEINLTGNAITTNGGEIALDGATIVNGNLTVDSSVIEESVITDGGDITFTSTLDSASAGGNLRLSSGTGNILFEDTVGGEATFKNINVLGANLVTATADITSDQVIRINSTGDIVTQNITSDNGRVVLASEQKSISTLDIASGSEERDNIILEAGDNVSTQNLSANELGTVRIASGKYLEQDSNIVGDITTESITGKQIRVDSIGNFTALGDVLAHDGNVVVDAKQDITVENITANNGNVRLISEEKSITAKDITSGSETERGNIILESKEGITTANLNARELGVVRITSGEIVENDTETLEDDTILVGDITTESITGKAVRAVGTGSFTATGDITANDGRITVAVTNDVNTKNINSLANSINLISTEGAVTVDGDLNSEKGGIAIHAANNIDTRKIRSFDGAVALSSYDGEITVEDDINAVRGNVTIAAKEGVEVANITTGIGEINIGSGKNIIANGNISTNVGYVNLKAGGLLDVQSVTTNDGYISLGADSNVEVQSLTTDSGVINVVSATGSANVAGSINTDGSYVTIAAFLDVIANTIEANGGGVDLVENFSIDETLIASGGVTDVNSNAINSLNDLTPEQAGLFSEIISDTLYHTRPVGEFLVGALYATVVNNFEDVFNAGQFLLQYPLALTDRDRRYWTQVINRQSTAFKLGVELGNAASIVQGIIEIISGGGTFLGGAALCTVGAGATFGISCAAGAPAMVTGAAISAHGLSLIKNGLENDTDANLIDDLFAPQKMESTGGADGVDGLAKKTGISGDSIKKVYGDVSSKDIELLGNKLDKNLAEHLFNKGGDGSTGSQLVNNVSDTLKKVGDDDVAIDSINSILRKNKNGKLNDSKTETAFSEAADFLGRHEGRVSGDFPTRFAEAQGKKGAVQAQNEIQVAENILDGSSPVGTNVSKVDGIPTDTDNTGVLTPDYKITDTSGISSLAEVKTPNGNFTKNNLQSNLTKAINQVKNFKNSDSTITGKAYITVDYSRKSPTNLSRNEIEQYSKFLIEQADGINSVEFVEILYKDTSNQLQKLLLKVQNGGIITLH